nr:acyltransferase [uncultured Dysosmobacter sp.]
MSLTILCYHYPTLFRPDAENLADPAVPAFVRYLFAQGHRSVEVFFMISGFLIYVQYGGKIRRGSIGLVPYISRRVVRLYPYAILTAVVAAACIWFSKAVFPKGHLFTAVCGTSGTRPTLISFFMSVFGVQSGWLNDGTQYSINNSAWYNGTLMICYGIFYVIGEHCKGDRVKENCCYITLVLVGAWIWGAGYEFPLMWPRCGRAYLNFFGGALLAQVVQSIDTDRKRHYVLAAGGTGVALYILCYKLGFLGSIGHANSMVLGPSLIIFMTVSRTVARISDNKFVQYLGKLAYGVYMWNQPFVMMLYVAEDIFGLNFHGNSPRVFWCYIVLVVLMAVVGHELFEKPVTKWCKRRFAKYLT